MHFSQENRVLLFTILENFCLTKSRISDPTASKLRFFVTLVNGSKPFTNITKSFILDVTGYEIRVCYLIFYWIVLFCYIESENSGPYSNLHRN